MRNENGPCPVKLRPNPTGIADALPRMVGAELYDVNAVCRCAATNTAGRTV